MLKRYSGSFASKGLTLIEVVASIALLGTLLVMLLQTHSKHVNQVTRSHQKSLAVERADQLMATWFSADEPFPRNGVGGFVGSPNMFWTTTSRRVVVGQNWVFDVITIRVFLENEAQPLLSLEVIDSLVPGNSSEVR